MYWTQKDTLDLILMIAGAVVGGTLALLVLHFVFIPFAWASFAVPGCAVAGAYGLRWAIWFRGLRKNF